MPVLDAEAQFQRPVADRLGAGLDADLVKPCVAGLRERLGEIQRTGVVFLPVVEGRGRRSASPAGPSNSSFSLIAPLSSAAMPTGTLKVEPGGYAER